MAAAGLLAPGTTRPVIALRALVVALPCLALALAVPQVPHWFVLLAVPLSAAAWARTPDHAVGIVPLVLVAGWWAARGVVDWRVLVVAVLLLGAHLSAVLLSYGPGTLPVDPRLVRLWLRRRPARPGPGAGRVAVRAGHRPCPRPLLAVAGGRVGDGRPAAGDRAADALRVLVTTR